MLNLGRPWGFLFVLLLVWSGTFGPASAAPKDDDSEGHSATTSVHGARLAAWLQKQSDAERSPGSGEAAPSNVSKNDGPGSPRPKIIRDDPNTVPQAEYEAKKKAWEARVAAINKANAERVNAYGACLDTASGLPCPRPVVAPQPDAFTLRPEADPANPGAPAPAPPNPALALPPEVIAYAAVVNLKIPAPTPGIGPPPSINEWDMAAVGYPLWLWAEGNLDPAPVSQTVYDLTVSLDARLVRVNFDMGDGNLVKCTNLKRKWTRAVTPGAVSPVCGYRYKEPSLPKGDYTVTARAVWAVDWAVNGQGGTIPFYTEASTELPVGELQVLVR